MAKRTAPYSSKARPPKFKEAFPQFYWLYIFGIGLPFIIAMIKLVLMPFMQPAESATDSAKSAYLASVVKFDEYIGGSLEHV